MVSIVSRLAPALDPALKTHFVEIIAERFGLSLSQQQLHALDGVIRDVLTGSQYESPADLYRAIAADLNGDLLESVVTHLTVGETHFFRILPQIHALRHTILPKLIGAQAASRRLSVWIAGCSTGEEAYTVAILLREQLPALDKWNVQIVATDINASSLDIARRGRYGMWSFRETPDEVRKRYFTADGKNWQLIDPVRAMVEFVQGNLAGGAVQTLSLRANKPDLILCRNVTIYFSSQAAQRLYRDLAAELAPGGWLILGPSDPPPHGCELLEPVYLSDAVLWRKPDPIDTAHGVRPVPQSYYSSLHTSPSVPSTGTQSKAAFVRSPSLAPHPSFGSTAPGRAVRQNAVQSGKQTVRESAKLDESERAREAEAHLTRGMASLEAGALVPALESLRRAAFLDANNAVAHFGLGQVHSRLGHLARARAAFIHARRVLAAMAEGSQPLDAGGLTADDLRHAVDLQLRELGDTHGA